jgi:mono/diheme cytochrome c family protein
VQMDWQAGEAALQPGGGSVVRALRRLSLPLGVALLLGMPMLSAPPHAISQVQAQSPAPASRGELLYRNHCIACHSTSVHWRDKRLVTDFGSLIAQVKRWEQNTGLGWSSEEILDVVQYLNTTIYRFANPLGHQAGTG